MSRSHSFPDQQFNTRNYHESDKGEFTENLVFVIMAFKIENSDRVYGAIKDECEKLKLNATRSDDEIGSGVIIRDIAKKIEDAEFLICDLTGNRPNVYYELGYAHGVGNEQNDILLIAKEGTEIHFDIQPLRIQFYKSEEDLKEKIRKNLNKMITETRGTDPNKSK